MPNRESRYHQVGVDRLIRLKWLDYASRLVMGSADARLMKQQLSEYLAPDFLDASPLTRGSLSKTVTILYKTWVQVPKDMTSFRDRGIFLLKHVDKSTQLAVHWGMISAAYPFWHSVASHTGRLLRLQNQLVAIQLQRRLKEDYGDRETVTRRARYILRAFVDWGVVMESERKGVYLGCECRNIEEFEMVEWLIEAMLRANPTGTGRLRDVFGSTALFPFRLPQNAPEILRERAQHIECVDDGHTEPMIMTTR